MSKLWKWGALIGLLVSVILLLYNLSLQGSELAGAHVLMVIPIFAVGGAIVGAILGYIRRYLNGITI